VGGCGLNADLARECPVCSPAQPPRFRAGTAATACRRARGLWRRTSLDSYRTEEPDWEVLIDVDALNAAEQEDWVWHGATVLRPEDSQPA